MFILLSRQLLEPSVRSGLAQAYAGATSRALQRVSDRSGSMSESGGDVQCAPLSADDYPLVVKVLFRSLESDLFTAAGKDFASVQWNVPDLGASPAAACQCSLPCTACIIVVRTHGVWRVRLKRRRPAGGVPRPGGPA